MFSKEKRSDNNQTDEQDRTAKKLKREPAENNHQQELKLGTVVIEDETKKIHEIVGDPDNILIISKDRIGDGDEASDMGIAVTLTAITAKVFEYLNAVGISTHYVRLHDEKSVVAKKCSMIPIDWVCRRYAIGSFLERNPDVSEGYRFCSLKHEMFYKGDEKEAQWSDEQVISADLKVGGKKIGEVEVELLHRATACIFELLERAWTALGCSLVDMKVQYGVTTNGKIVLASVIDTDSWHLWPEGDRKNMVDTQVCRNLSVATADDLETVKKHFRWVADQVQKFLSPPKGQAVILTSSASKYKSQCTEIKNTCAKFGVPAILREAPALSEGEEERDAVMSIISEYEGYGQPIVFIAIAGVTYLSPSTTEYSASPVINSPPSDEDWSRKDDLNSLELPCGLGCTAVYERDGAATAAAQTLALTDHCIWSRLKANQLKTWVKHKVELRSRKKMY